MTLGRPKLNLLIDDVIRYKIKNIYISNEDRLCRMSFNMIKELFLKFGAQIIVINNIGINKTYEQELLGDIINLIHSFSMKMYTNRRQKKLQIIN